MPSAFAHIQTGTLHSETVNIVHKSMVVKGMENSG